MRRALLVFGLALVMLLPAAAWAQRDGRVAASSFRVSWTPSSTAMVPRIIGHVLNDSQYLVTNVRLVIEGLDADHHSVGRAFTWAFGDIEPGGKTAFSAEPIRGSVSYRIEVVSWDLVSFIQAP